VPARNRREASRSPWRRPVTWLAVADAGLAAALELKRAGRLDEAVIALESVLARPGGAGAAEAVALVHLAEVQVRRRRLGEAAEALERAEAAAGVSAFSARVRGDLRHREQRYSEAAGAYREATALGEQGTWSLVQLGRCCLRTGDLDGAGKGAAGRAVERDGAASGAWLILGEVARRQGDLDEALERFEQAHRCAPADEFAYAKLIEARLPCLAPDERVREVEVLLRSQGSGKENRHLLGVLAKVAADAGDPARAAEVWRQRRERHRGDFLARKMEAYALRKAGQLDRAAPLFRSCVMEAPHDVILFQTYIRLQHERGARRQRRSRAPTAPSAPVEAKAAAGGSQLLLGEGAVLHLPARHHGQLAVLGEAPAGRLGQPCRHRLTRRLGRGSDLRGELRREGDAESLDRDGHDVTSGVTAGPSHWVSRRARRPGRVVRRLPHRRASCCACTWLGAGGVLSSRVKHRDSIEYDAMMCECERR
jgi:tetratricopeptide (TPR) repeat protein